MKVTGVVIGGVGLLLIVAAMTMNSYHVLGVLRAIASSQGPPDPRVLAGLMAKGMEPVILLFGAGAAVLVVGVVFLVIGFFPPGPVPVYPIAQTPDQAARDASDGRGIPTT